MICQHGRKEVFERNMLARLLDSSLKKTSLGLIASAFVMYAWSLNCIGKGNQVGEVK